MADSNGEPDDIEADLAELIELEAQLGVNDPRPPEIDDETAAELRRRLERGDS